MTHRTLFDPAPLAATADPDTSHASAREHVASGAQGEHCRRVLELVRMAPGSTYVELWEGQSGRQILRDVEIMRRLNDLRHAGLVRQGPPRTCRVKGTKMVVWLPVG